LAKTGVKAKTSPLQQLANKSVIWAWVFENIRHIFAFASLAAQ
jgi:hypothetical protein